MSDLNIKEIWDDVEQSIEASKSFVSTTDHHASKEMAIRMFLGMLKHTIDHVEAELLSEGER
jgi:hypothetical protein